jgi:hypothetical protein
MYLQVINPPKRTKDGKIVKYAIIAGKQRLETIWGFKADLFPLSKDFVYNDNEKVNAKGMKYSELSEEYPALSVHFDSFVLPVILVRTDDCDLIEDMFSRLNEGVPLSAAEKRNAIGGPMAKAIRDLAQNKFFTKKVRIRNSRYQHLEVAGRLMFIENSLMHNQLIDTKKTYLDEFVWTYKRNKNLSLKELYGAVIKILESMNEVFEDTDEMLMSQGVIPIYYLLYRSLDKLNKAGNVDRKDLDRFREAVRINRKEAEEDLNKANFELLEYHRLSIQGTNDASSIRERYRIISKFFHISLPLTSDGN